jgi:quercetin dioxygenase-like cupin family protein
MDREPVSVLGRPLPASFQVRLVVVAPGAARRYDEAEWRDAFVVVERGLIVLESRDGERRRMETGATLWLAGLPLRRLLNPGREPAVLVAVSRRRAA